MESDELTIHAENSFVTAQDVPQDSGHGPAYTITCPPGMALAVPAGSPVVAEFRDACGAKLDERTTVRIQKCDQFGRPVATVFREELARFRYERMRTDPDYFRVTGSDVLLEEDERLTVYLDLPDPAVPGFSAEQSRFALGDTTSVHGEAPELVDLGDLTTDEREAIKAASSAVSAPRPAPGHRVPDRPARPAARQQRDLTDSEGRPDARVAYEDEMDEDEQRLLEETTGLPDDELSRWWRKVSSDEVPDEDDVADELADLEREVAV